MSRVPTPAVRDGREAWVALYEEAAARRAPEPAWLAGRREAGIARVAAVGLPTTRHEEWRFTNPAPIARTTFAPPSPPRLPLDAPGLREVLGLVPNAAACLVFVDGRFAPDLSLVPRPEARWAAGSLAEAVARTPERLEGALAHLADPADSPFTALNQALFEDGAFVHLPREASLEAPLHLVFIAAGDGGPVAAHPRNLLLLEAGSRASVVETHVDVAARSVRSPTLANVVTEVSLAPGARLDHVRVLRGGAESLHVGLVRAAVGRDAGFGSLSVALGGRLSRVEIDVLLGGEGASATLDGLYLAAGREHVDHHTRIDHAFPRGTSRELYKGILDGEASAVFAGRILVREGAQKTDARQANHNLLLSETAVVDAKPELEIFADDVKCAHGATVGQMDEEAVFYLRSRGIGHAEARALLLHAFAAEVLGRASPAGLSARLEAWLGARLPGGGAP